jgi:hypothetical protein
MLDVICVCMGYNMGGNIPIYVMLALGSEDE